MISNHTSQFVTTSGGYEAIQNTGRRKATKTRTYHEDKILDGKKRKQLAATTRDAVRNFAIASWVVRKHLDYVTAFTFQAQCPGHEEFAEQLEAFVKRKSRKENCHVSMRHPLRRMVRMAEARRVIDGDIGIEKIAGKGRIRGKLNVIESDRIQHDNNQEAMAGTEWINGVQVRSATGEALRYAIAKRVNRGSMEHHKYIQSRNMYLHAYWDSTHRFDQVRGISPISAALNDYRDISESFDLSKMRIKVAQMFGLKITSSTDEPDLGGPETDDDADGVVDSIDLSGGPFQLDLAPGEDAAFLESKTPAIETVNFLKLMIHVALKAIDVPYSFFDESHTNFFGSRGALLHYLRSCKTKQQDNQELLDWITRFWIGIGVVDGELELPPDLDFDHICWEWVPDGVPWWDPSKEVDGNSKAVGAHMDNLERICRSNGTDVYENIRINARVAKEAEEAGMPLMFPFANTPVAVTDSDGTDETEGEEE